MSPNNLKNTPKNFRYLLSLKEIKEIEKQNEIKFKTITTGNVTNSAYFEKEKHIQSSFRALSIHCFKNANLWEFSIFQSGFRSELLPNEFEIEVKTQTIHGVGKYIHKIIASIETDGLKSPQMWVHVMIINDKIKCNFNEIK